MSFSPYCFKASVLAAALLATSTSAQNATNSTDSPEGCGMSSGYDIPINASGSTNVSDFYVSVTLGDSRANNRTSDPWLYGYLSVPENSTRRTCMYMFTPKEGTTEGDEANDCSSIINQKCIDYMEHNLQLPIYSYGSQGPENMRCDSLDWGSDEFEDACGSVDLGSSIATSYALNTTNTTCAYSEPPKGVDWGLPDGYKTFLMYGIGVEPYDTGVDNYTDYERAGRTPVPFVVTSIDADGQIPQTQVVCVAPDQAIEGSHEVPESAGASLAWKGAGSMAVLMAAIAGTSLVAI